MILRTLLPLAAMLVPGLALAQETRSLDGRSSPPAAITDVAWLAGTWRGEALGGTATEVYSAPDAGQITGHFTQTKGGKVAFYEIMQIVPAGRSLVYRLRHFNADLTGWEDGKQGRAVEFPLVAIEPDAVHFDGMTFRRTAPDAITVWVKIRHDDGTTTEEPFRYTRAR